MGIPPSAKAGKLTKEKIKTAKRKNFFVFMMIKLLTQQQNKNSLYCRI